MAEVNVLGILPARGGSKGIPGKNLKMLCGRPLLAWPAEVLAHAPSLSRAICSTDDEAIAKVAREYGLEIPFYRPAALATDTAMVADVIRHAVDALDNPAKPFTHVALVQATSPTVVVNDVEQAIDLVRKEGADTVITGFRAGMQHPAVMYTLKADGTVAWLKADGFHSKRRQDYPTVFTRTGLVYIISVAIVRERGAIYGDRIRTLIVDEDRAVTIDEERDFLRAERIMEMRNG